MTFPYSTLHLNYFRESTTLIKFNENGDKKETRSKRKNLINNSFRNASDQIYLHSPSGPRRLYVQLRPTVVRCLIICCIIMAQQILSIPLLRCISLLRVFKGKHFGLYTRCKRSQLKVVTCCHLSLHVRCSF